MALPHLKNNCIFFPLNPEDFWRFFSIVEHCNAGDAAAGWLVIPVTAVPLPGVTGLAGYEVGGSLVLHPLSKSQQNPGVVIPRVRSRPAGGTGGSRRMRSQHKSQSSCFLWFFVVFIFFPRTTRPLQLSYEARQFSSEAQRRLYMGILCT